MTAPSGPITPADIKNKLGDIQGEAQEQVESAKNQILAVGVVVAVLMLLAAFLLGAGAQAGLGSHRGQRLMTFWGWL